jgi:hypothetical protein
VTVGDGFAERPERQAGKLKALDTDRDSDNGDAAKKAGQEPLNGQNEASQKNPENIQNCFHMYCLPSLRNTFYFRYSILYHTGGR